MEVKWKWLYVFYKEFVIELVIKEVWLFCLFYTTNERDVKREWVCMAFLKGV